ncbi:Cof-type HAD-IIB family hydrolase [Auritidibacter ignavus]|uniref:Cof-type HAD-IIB family hydrolase n=1 Tax=Auritidibacter ignavus TaxID=678932 RepID=A0AAJ6AM05_9MICC|nr:MULTISPECIES: Cof-type HAD-IIB family hydrolase [Auritidibacter]WGH80906.1 Cof-type HAD-IIB family hydrolase [Auritidibacter ignavus]WGH85521.1 Cof-type HAD-IIB family hydrolase [Auritidibacter ignavus]WGH87808.1 Cof-type HAD-IIB family hydrolase [Auritidibacter ignavus]WGH92426.1 Cof-type HAD-IIB family hydrolase [Auritidibacter ignavus]WHS29208.1 Cof-type HAD-IIB family hydrolase [Auritidibacter ignavus]
MNRDGLSPHGESVERDATGHPVRRPGLIASDLDGTIISYRHPAGGSVITPRTTAAFQAAQEAGIPVVFVTGRPMRWMSGLVATLNGPAICSNGAVIYDLSSETVLEAHPIPVASVVAVYEELRRIEPGARCGFETLTGFVVEAGFRDDHPEDPSGYHPGGLHHYPRTIDGLDEHPGVLKFMVRVPDREPDQLLARVRAHLGTTVTVTHSAPGQPLLEISRADVNKAATLADYATSLGVHANEVVAFGDQLNDVEMIRWAGTGYAVGSGHPELKAAANAVTADCDDDGVAAVIEHLMHLPT